VVHGPFTAVKLATLALGTQTRPLATFEFQGRAPLFVDQPIYLRRGDTDGLFEAIRLRRCHGDDRPGRIPMTTSRNDGLLSQAEAAIPAARRYLAAAREVCIKHMAPDGRTDLAAAERGQRMLHGLAWIATLVEALDATNNWAVRMGRFGGSMPWC